MIFSATDPVCQMRINKRSALVKLKYSDKTYFFCSTHCKTAFKKAPQKYLNVAEFSKKPVMKKKKGGGCCG